MPGKISSSLSLDASDTTAANTAAMTFDGAEDGFEYLEEPAEGATVDMTYQLPEDNTEGTRTQTEVVRELLQPLDRTTLKQRKGAFGKTLDYLEWATVAGSLNRVFGFGNWSSRVIETMDLPPFDGTNIPVGVKATVALTVRFPNGRVARYTNLGFGETRRAWNKDKGTFDPPSWTNYGVAYKGAASDGLKRCAVYLGNQFGLSLSLGEDATSESPSMSSGSASSSPASSTASSSTATEAGTTAACETCGRAITGYTPRGGSRSYTTADMVNFSRRDCDGHVFCYDHKQQWKREHGS